MGKRKDRRMNTGRRVKLCLFEEPPGDVDGARLANVEVGGYMDAKHHVSELTQTQSSIGQKSENPLLLLEQYVDDELDEDPRKRNRSCSIESLPDHDDNDKVEELQSHNCDIVVTANGVEGVADAEIEFSEMETSNQNPNILSACEEGDKGECFATTPVELFNTIDQTPVCYDTRISADGYGSWNMVFHEASNQYYYWNVETGETSWHAPDSLTKFSTPDNVPVVSGPAFVANCISPPEQGTAGAPPDLFPLQEQVIGGKIYSKTNDLNEEGCDKTLIIGTEEPNGVVDEYNEDDKVKGAQSDEENVGVDVERDSDIPRSLLEQGMTLLEKFKSLEGLKESNGESGSVSNYCMEIEIRISDIKELSSHTLSLLPFWDHLQRRFEQLENTVNDIYVNFPKTLAETGNSVDPGLFIEEKSTPEIVDCTGLTEMPNGRPDHLAELDDKPSSPPDPTTGSVFGNFGNDAENDNNYEVNPCFSPFVEDGEIISPAVQNGDTDMVVDMEIEEEPECSSRNGTAFSASEGHPIHVTLSGGGEWAPPLPSDSELIPPPPAEEPYPLEVPPQFEIYQHAVNNGVPGSRIFGQEDQPGFSQGPLCYGLVHNPYPEATPATDPPSISPYYHMGDGDPPPIPLPVATSEPGAPFSSSCSSVLSTSPEPGSEVSAVEIPAISTSAAADPGNSCAPERLCSKSMSDPASVSTTKPQAKVRTVRRGIVSAPSLRSNKKVFSMLDKWKAAKEELHEDIEDEPESAYEAFEKKKQKEIQEWHAQHIASGDAKENANFQPLGSDWRERVKQRRKKRAGKEACASPADDKCPDLFDLSQHLPPGWQAYWDESSKMVYYGNLVTSQTVWDAPSK